MLPNALTFWRAARRLAALGLPVLPGALEALGRRLNTTHIAPDAWLGTDVELGYGGIGIVIGPGARVGDRSFLSQGVSLVPERPGGPAPQLGRDVMVGAGAQIIGGVRVGDGASIGANALVLEDVPAGGVVVGVPARLVRTGPRAPAPRSLGSADPVVTA